MANSFFKFKQFTVHQDKCAMKVTTDSCLFGAWAAKKVSGSGNDRINVLDAGAGTGLLSLMLAQENPSAEIDAIEIDKAATQQAEENIRVSPFKDRITTVCGDIQNVQFSKKYDIIISNPPFYENELRGDNVAKNTAHHDEGLQLAQLLKIITGNLIPGGRFYLLLPYKRNTEIKNLLLKHTLHINEMVVVRQSVNHDYFRIMLEGSIKPGEVTETLIDELSIMDETQQYTPKFARLLKEYYLNL